MVRERACGALMPIEMDDAECDGHAEGMLTARGGVGGRDQRGGWEVWLKGRTSDTSSGWRWQSSQSRQWAAELVLPGPAQWCRSFDFRAPQVPIGKPATRRMASVVGYGLSLRSDPGRQVGLWLLTWRGRRLAWRRWWRPLAAQMRDPPGFHAVRRCAGSRSNER